MQPEPRDLPVAAHRRRGALHELRRLVDGEASEEAELDDPPEARVHRRELGQRGIERLEIDPAVSLRRRDVDEIDAPGAAAPLQRAVLARVRDENLTHRAGGDAEEMRSILPVDPAARRKPDEHLVHERGGLQRVFGPLAAQVAARKRAQLAIDERNELIERGLANEDELNSIDASVNRQLEAISGRLEEIASRKLPIIVAGDFNDWRHRATAILERQLGMTEVSVAHAGRVARTYPSILPLLRLDRIYVRGFEVKA